MFSKKNSIKLGIGLVALVTAASFTLLRNPEPTVTGDPKVDKLKYPAGFKAEHLYSPSENKIGSWVSMAFDDKGRMICSDQYGKLFRLKMPAIDAKLSTANIEKLKIGPATDTMGMGYAHGLLYAFNSLYVMINNGKNNKEFTKKSGLYRLQDTDNDDQFDKITLLKELVGEGEHGPHSIVLSPDKQSLYVISGNHTDIPTLDGYRLPSNWQEDQMFPHIKDPRGHANDRYAPGGWIANLDPEGKKWELVSAGYRNAFDLAFNEAGDMFVYDSDMEWEFGLPWYRPTRIMHATSGSEFGWRQATNKWSPTFPDNLPPILNIGQGSPTNLLHLKDAKFPAKYKNTLLGFDWTFGVIHAVHLKPSGSTYTGEREEFLSGIPLPLTDGAIGPDGALYFLTGGRRLESDLYRVSYVGNENTSPVAVVPINSANALRRSLEKFHTGGPNSAAVATSWQHLKSSDRFIRYAARLALEHQPVAQWQDLALKEKDPVALTQSLISLIRMGDGSKKNEIVNALLAVNFKALTQSQQLDILRTFELAFLRMGQPDAALKTKVIAYLNPHYPANIAHLNRSLSKLLIYLDAPEAVAKTMALMDVKIEPGSDALNIETATASSDLILRNPQYGKDIAAMLANLPPAQHTYYAVMLSLAKEGWTPALQDKYFKWYYGAFGYKGGNSYIGFLDRSLKLALKNIPDNKRAYFEKLAGAERISKNGNDFISATAPKGPGRNWRIENSLPIIEKGLVDRDFENGKAMYAATTCKMCHGMKGEGGAIGPDLSQLYTRFSSKDMLEAIIEPNKTVSDQYAATYYSLKNGSSIVGRLINEDKVAYYISQNPYAPNELEKVLKKNVISSKPSAASIMFGGLINSLNEDELKDLMAYLMAGGNENNGMFSPKAVIKK